jgi:microcystin-dependent protein
MKLRVDTDVSLPPWLKRAALTAIVPISLVALAGVVSADEPATFKEGETLSAEKLNKTFSGLDARLTKVEGHVPPGTIVAFGGATAPAGWLPCDGTLLDSAKEEYRGLFQAIGTGHGGNATSGMFNLPDFRGRFLRGVDSSEGNDPDAPARTASNPGGNEGDNVGTLQSSSVGPHTHPYGAAGTKVVGNVASGNSFQADGMSSFVSTTSANSGTGSSSETRPVNVSVKWIIKL